MRTCVYFYYTE